MERAIRADPLYELSSAEKELIWKFRYHCIKIPEAMPKLLRSVNWADLEQVRERKRREREREREREMEQTAQYTNCTLDTLFSMLFPRLQDYRCTIYASQ